MKDQSLKARLLFAFLLFAVCYGPVFWLWGMAQPAYAEFLVVIAGGFVNAIETGDTSYEVEIVDDALRVQTKVQYQSPAGTKTRVTRSRGRGVDEVSYNLVLWVSLWLATAWFVGASARWRFLLIGLVLIIFWHVCDVTIFAKNCRWIVIDSLSRQFPGVKTHSYSWQWFWQWAYRLNIRVMDPLLPMLLWLLFCARSFLTPQPTQRPIDVTTA